MPPIRIRIANYAFSIPRRYTEGQPLSAAEAQALNGLMAENVRNNFAKVVRRELAGTAEQELTQEILDELQQQVWEYAQRYTFPLQHEAKGWQGPLEREALRVAATWASEATEEELVQLAQDPMVLAEARRRLVAQAQLAQTALGDLL